MPLQCARHHIRAAASASYRRFVSIHASYGGASTSISRQRQCASCDLFKYIRGTILITLLSHTMHAALFASITSRPDIYVIALHEQTAWSAEANKAKRKTFYSQNLI